MWLLQKPPDTELKRKQEWLAYQCKPVPSELKLNAISFLYFFWVLMVSHIPLLADEGVPLLAGTVPFTLRSYPALPDYGPVNISQPDIYWATSVSASTQPYLDIVLSKNHIITSVRIAGLEWLLLCHSSIYFSVL